MFKTKNIGIIVVLLIVALTVMFSLDSKADMLYPSHKDAYNNNYLTYRDSGRVYFPHNIDTVRVISEISTASVNEHCRTIKDHETVVLFSNGGEVHAGVRLALCLKAANVRLMVVKAISIAPTLVLLSDNVCFASHVSFEVHQPGYAAGVEAKISRGGIQSVYAFIYAEMVHAGADPIVASLWVNLMDLVPNITTAPVPPAVFAAMLGDSYKGICKIHKPKPAPVVAPTLPQPPADPDHK